jgi:hypothetical protein
VYVTGFDGNLSVFDAAGCGKATCKPLRAYDVGDAGSTTTPALVGDTLLSSTQATPDPNTSGVVAAFPANGCGRPICQPRGLTQLGPDQSYQGRRSRWPAAR